MDPAYITNADWSMIATVNNGLVLFTVMMIVAALFFVAAHAMIPSLVSTYQLSSRVLRMRRPLYVASLGVLLVALFTIGLVVMNAISVVSRLFPRWWI